MQTPENNRDPEPEALKAPPRLVSALKQSSKASIFIPPTVDEAILRAAQAHLGRRKASAFKWSLIIRWAAATAALVLLLAIMAQFLRKPSPAPNSDFAREDLNHDRTVDILDAFALATELRSGTSHNAQLDINEDGLIDDRDVATLAARAVSLEKAGGS